MRSNSKKRYGYVIDTDRYKTSTVVNLICGVIAIIIIPLQIFLENLITSFELPMIANI